MAVYSGQIHELGLLLRRPGWQQYDVDEAFMILFNNRLPTVPSNQMVRRFLNAQTDPVKVSEATLLRAFRQSIAMDSVQHLNYLLHNRPMYPRHYSTISDYLTKGVIEALKYGKGKVINRLMRSDQNHDDFVILSREKWVQIWHVVLRGRVLRPIGHFLDRDLTAGFMHHLTETDLMHGLAHALDHSKIANNNRGQLLPILDRLLRRSATSNDYVHMPHDGLHKALLYAATKWPATQDMSQELNALLTRQQMADDRSALDQYALFNLYIFLSIKWQSRTVPRLADPRLTRNDHVRLTPEFLDRELEHLVTEDQAHANGNIIDVLLMQKYHRPGWVSVTLNGLKTALVKATIHSKYEPIKRMLFGNTHDFVRVDHDSVQWVLSHVTDPVVKDRLQNDAAASLLRKKQ